MLKPHLLKGRVGIPRIFVESRVAMIGKATRLFLSIMKQEGEMKTRTIIIALLFAILYPTNGGFISTLSAAEHSMSGQAKMTVIKKEALPVGDIEGHFLMLSEAHGSNTNTGE